MNENVKPNVSKNRRKKNRWHDSLGGVLIFLYEFAILVKLVRWKLYEFWQIELIKGNMWKELMKFLRNEDQKNVPE